MSQLDALTGYLLVGALTPGQEADRSAPTDILTTTREQPEAPGERSSSRASTYAGSRTVLDDISFRIRRGSVTGLLGPSGRGERGCHGASSCRAPEVGAFELSTGKGDVMR